MSNHDLLVLNGSRILDFLRCSIYYDLRQQYRRRDEDTHSVDFGTAVHAALEAWYAPTGKDGKPGMHDEAAIHAFRTAIDWSAHDPEARDIETSGYGETLLRRYFDYWREADSQTIKRVLATEKTLRARIKIGPANVVLVGRLDAIIEDETGRLWHFQHKTVSAYTSPTSYVQSLQLSPHETLYRALGRANGYPIVGSYVNLLRKMKLPRGSLSSWAPFHRERVVVPPGHVKEWISEDLEWISVLILDKDVRYRNTANCMKWNRLCEYHPFCAGLPIDEEEYVPPEEDYVTETEKMIKDGELDLESIPLITFEEEEED